MTVNLPQRENFTRCTIVQKIILNKKKRKGNTMNKKILRSIIFFSLTAVINTKTIIDPTIKLIPPVDSLLAPSPVAEKIKKYLTIETNIQSEFSFDTRQVNGLASNQSVVLPDKKRLDPTGKDINARGKGIMVGTEGSLRAVIAAPEIKEGQDKEGEGTDGLYWSAAMETNLAAGFINETGFLDTEQLTARRAYALAELVWLKSGQKIYTLSFGRKWHPMFVPTCFPETISSNTGDPIDPFSTSTQFLFTGYNERFNIIAAALSQSDTFSDGPDGFSSKYIRNAIVPNLHGQIQIKIGDHSFGPGLDYERTAPRTEIGTGFDYKRLVPRIETQKGFKARESINSIAAMWYARVDWKRAYFKTKIIFAENFTDFKMLGGYAVHTIDPVTDERTYTNLRTFSVWLDTATITKKMRTRNNQKKMAIEPGIFVGFTKNLGASKTIKPNVTDNEDKITEKRVFGIGTNIDTVLRISPRLQWHHYSEQKDVEGFFMVQDVTMAVELEYTRAAYGTLNNKGKVINTIPVGNVRILFSTFHYFA